MSAEEIAVLEWLERQAPFKPRRDDLSKGVSSLATHLTSAGLGQLAAELPMEADDEKPRATGASVERAIAGALAEFVRRDPSRSRFETVDQLLEHSHETWALFQSRVTGLLRTDATSRSALAQRLAAEPALLLAEPNSVAMHSHIAPAELARRYQSDASVREMWSSTVNRVQMLSSLEHRILCAVDPVGWLRILESHTFPEAVFGLVEGACLDEMTELLPLLRAAAPAYDGEGRWLRDRLAVFPIVAAGERILQRHAGLGQNSREQDEEAFDNALDLLVATLRSRSDFDALGRDWLERLAWQDRVARGWEPFRGHGLESALWRTFSKVVKNLKPLPDPIEWIAEEEDTWGADRLVAVLAPIAFGPDHSAAESLLTDVVRGNLVNSSSLAASLRSPRTVLVRTIAAAMSNSNDSAVWFSTTWKNCFATRDRIRHAEARLTLHGRDPGAFTAACACAILIGTDHATSPLAALERLWDELRKAVVETMLTVRGPDDTFRVIARWLALSFGEVHGAANTPTRASRLAGFVNPLRGPSSFFVQLVADLVGGGATVSEIDGAMKGPAVGCIVARTLEDARRKAPSGYVERQKLAQLEELRGRITAP